MIDLGIVRPYVCGPTIGVFAQPSEPLMTDEIFPGGQKAPVDPVLYASNVFYSMRYAPPLLSQTLRVSMWHRLREINT